MLDEFSRRAAAERKHLTQVKRQKRQDEVEYLQYLASEEEKAKKADQLKKQEKFREM